MPFGPPKIPPPPQAPPSENVIATYKRLSQAAADLNAVSDDLSKPIHAWETELKKLNLGLSAWVELSAGGAGGLWWDRCLGYAKAKDGWSIMLRQRQGREGLPDDVDSEEAWPFDEAPRWMRIEAIAKLPDLLNALLKQTEETTLKIRKRMTLANELAYAIGKLAAEAESADRK